MTGATRPYHHGDLRRALLAAAEAILDRAGPSGLTLRAVAREAGVSHAAPAHHFGDLVGLLSELAAIGYTRFGERLAAAAAAAPPAAVLQAMGFAYVGFAGAHPGLFQVMFRSERLDMNRPALREAADAAWAELGRAVADRSTLTRTTLADTARRIAPWALAHGLAFLLIDGRLASQLATLPTRERNMDALVRATLGAMTLQPAE